MGRYAKNTAVSSEKSRGEIERILIRYGATGFAYGWQATAAVITFVLNDRRIQFRIEMPLLEDYAKTDTGRARRRNIQQQEWEKAQRQRWRALKLIIHAKLEAVEGGIYTFEEAFMGDTILPDGMRVADHVLPGIAQSYASGKVVMGLLPATTSK